MRESDVKRVDSAEGVRMIDRLIDLFEANESEDGVCLDYCSTMMDCAICPIGNADNFKELIEELKEQTK
jgi:hypothetical protein